MKCSTFKMSKTQGLVIFSAIKMNKLPLLTYTFKIPSKFPDDNCGVPTQAGNNEYIKWSLLPHICTQGLNYIIITLKESLLSSPHGILD